MSSSLPVTREIRALLAALLYFTRLPLPVRIALDAEDWRRATAWWPLVGAGLGAVSGGVLLAAGAVLPPPIAAGLAVAVGLLLTGAQHEDGLADTCDGLGGGGTDRARILEIMRDSRVGAFAVAGLVVVIGLRWQALAALPAAVLVLAPVAAAALSRATAAALMAVLSYARTDPSRAAPVVSRLDGGRLVLVLALGVMPVLLLPAALALTALAIAVALWAIAALWLRHRLGGFTGDCLGATQQVVELAVLLAVVALA